MFIRLGRGGALPARRSFVTRSSVSVARRRADSSASQTEIHGAGKRIDAAPCRSEYDRVLSLTGSHVPGAFTDPRAGCIHGATTGEIRTGVERFAEPRGVDDGGVALGSATRGSEPGPHAANVRVLQGETRWPVVGG